MQRVIGIGETVMDILFKDDQPQKAVPGGSTFNSIISLGRAGVPCAMLTEVGGDHIGELICNFLRDNGVATDYVCRHEHIKSHISLAFLDENNDAQYIFYKDHASVTLDGPLPEIRKDDVVLFGSFFAINPAIRPVVGALLRAAHEAGAWLYYDVNFRKNHIADLPRVMANIEENMSLANVVRGSMEDFGFLYGLHDADAVYERVRRHCPTLILTDGARPIRVYTPDACYTFPVEPVETVSTVGAGDNFNAGYIYAKLTLQSAPLRSAQRDAPHLENPQPSSLIPPLGPTGRSTLGEPSSGATQSALIAMAQRWSQDVCCQIGNHISATLAASLSQGHLEDL